MAMTILEIYDRHKHLEILSFSGEMRPTMDDSYHYRLLHILWQAIKTEAEIQRRALEIYQKQA